MELLVEDEHSTDVTGVNNIRLHCNREDPHDLMEGLQTRKWGTWKGVTDCGPETQICGFKTCVQKDQGRCEGCDDLALTGVEIYCCEVD